MTPNDRLDAELARRLSALFPAADSDKAWSDLRQHLSREKAPGPLAGWFPVPARRLWLRSAAAAVTLVIVSLLLYSGWEALRPEPRLVITDQELEPVSPGGDTGSAGTERVPGPLEIEETVVYAADWGEALGEFGFEAPNESTGWGPESLAVHDGRLYIADPVNRRVQRLDADGEVELIYSLGPDSRLAFVDDIVVSPDGTLLVLDAWSHPGVQAFAPDGQYVGLLELPPGDTVGILDLVASEETVYLGRVPEPGGAGWIAVFRDGRLLSQAQVEQQTDSQRLPLGGGLEITFALTTPDGQDVSKPAIWRGEVELISLAAEDLGLEDT